MVVNSPIIAVVMSVFNGQAYLRGAVESILAQTFTDFEFVIIDDGSTDKTAEILSDYAKRDDRVRVVSHENRGRAESLNRGIELARAPLIARMDADDISLPHRLKEQADFLERHPEVGLLSGAYDLMGSDNKILNTIRLPLGDLEIRTRMLDYNAMCHPAVIMRKDIVLSAGGYRRAFSESEDYDLWLRMAERTRLANLEQVVLQYRIHPGQASIQNMQHQTWCILAARVAASLRRSGKPDPLWSLEEITPASLAALGVTEAEIRRALVRDHMNWIWLLQQSDPELAIRVNTRLARLSRSESMQRPALADTWLKAAAAQYRQGKPARALVSAMRGLLIRPIVVGRPAKRAFTRIGASFRG
jgi:hypothetical protein